MVKNIPEAYEVILKEDISDVQSEGWLLRHRKTGARVVLLSNDDENKVFSIAFRTPPADSTGAAHIIEHTVLCGSEKFPLKDPFVELAKGSLNTFLNAVTFPDKTAYPVASCNDVDFRNLMDVYLDAVFHPNIYRNEKIFLQEGWHYHLEKEDDPLTLNGVVYNEMKGAYSTPESILDRETIYALYPDTPYGRDSGGDPDHIPELTYEEFLRFHSRYYHPSNSYIYLYGNMDMDETLDFIDRDYLSHYDMAPVDSEIPSQQPFEQMKTLVKDYPVLDDEPLEQSAYLSESWVVGDCSDPLLTVGFSVLEYVLLDAPGAPVKQALLDAGIGKDVYGTYEDDIKQPFFSVTANNAGEEACERFHEIITETLRKIADEGIDEKAILSGINYFEFRFREADYASWPKGLIYNLGLFGSWLYDDMNPFLYLKQLRIFDELKEKRKEGFFEKLIRECLLDNPHRVLLTLRPKRGLAAEREAAAAKELEAYKASLTGEQIRELVKKTEELQAYQSEPDEESVARMLPMLSREDIAPETPVRICTEEHRAEDTVILHHPYSTNGISYLCILFDMKDVSEELLPYASLLKSLLGYVSTEHYTYGELFHEINAQTGGISCGLQVFPKLRDGGSYTASFGVRAKYLYPQQKFVFDMIREIIMTSDLKDAKRLREIIASQKVRMQSGIPASGHVSAARRALSGVSELSLWQEMISGIAFYRVVEDLEAHFEERFDDLTEKLERVRRIIFRPENMIVSVTCEAEGFEGIEASAAGLKKDLFPAEKTESGSRTAPAPKREGFMTPGQVQYVASAGDFRSRGFEYTGVLRILKTILNYDYLWQNLRVLGGAYGCMCEFRRTGGCYLVSYRDPHLKNTLDVYAKLPEYLASFEADEREMTKYIIGTISELDTPMTASGKGSLAMNAYFTGITEDDFQKERDEILRADAQSVRDLSALAAAVFTGDAVCVIGSESVLNTEGSMLESIENLNSTAAEDVFDPEAEDAEEDA